MNWETWKTLNREDRERLRDNSSLTPQLVGLEGKRVEVSTTYGETRRFWVGRSTGWIPIHLEVKTTRSLDGVAADRQYAGVHVIRECR